MMGRWRLGRKLTLVQRGGKWVEAGKDVREDMQFFPTAFANRCRSYRMRASDMSRLGETQGGAGGVKGRNWTRSRARQSTKIANSQHRSNTTKRATTLALICLWTAEKQRWTLIVMSRSNKHRNWNYVGRVQKFMIEFVVQINSQWANQQNTPGKTA